MAASILRASIWNVSRSVSTNTGSAFSMSTTLTVATNVYGGTITSSPGPDAERGERREQRAGAVRRRQAPLGARQLGIGLLKSGGALAIASAVPLAALQRADERLLLPLVDDRPGRPALRAHLLAAQYGGLLRRSECRSRRCGRQKTSTRNVAHDIYHLRSFL